VPVVFYDTGASSFLERPALERTLSVKKPLIVAALVVSLAAVACDNEEPTPAPTPEPTAVVTEAPATEAPATEAPATEAPAEETEAPAEETEAPAEATEAPAEESPEA
jgi:hypothetical protein